MKKDVPLAVLQYIEPILTRLNQAQLLIERNGNSIFRVTDAEAGSDFYFDILNSEVNNSGSNTVKISQKPVSAVNIGAVEFKVLSSQIDSAFKNWLDIVQGYQEVKTVFDDPILKQYAEDFYTEFESADPDATTASFSLKQQLLLDAALTQVIHVLEAKKDENNKEVIAELIEQAEEIQNTVTENTKQETLTKMSKLFAKIRKGGIKWIKDVYPIIEKEIIGAVVKGAVAAGAVAAAHLLGS